MIHLASGVLAVLVLALANGSGEPARAASFSKDVMPILKENCLKCHDEKEKKGGLIMDSYDALMKSEKKPVKAGDPKNSPLIQKTTGNKPEMPKNAQPLEPSQIRILTAWIKEGAKNN
jgi:uncharacterized membrane protein